MPSMQDAPGFVQTETTAPNGSPSRIPREPFEISLAFSFAYGTVKGSVRRLHEYDDTLLTETSHYPALKH